MTRLKEWQKELVGLSVGAWVVHVLMLAALVSMFVLAFGRYAN